MSEHKTSYREAVRAHLHSTLEFSDLPYLGKKSGKVRDSYQLDNDRLLFVVTDRLSAFDRVLTTVPFKGQVLNLTSAWWFSITSHIIANHLLAVVDPCASIVSKCTPFPVEFVVRDYMTGSTSTSLWTHYKAGERIYCGNVLPDGVKKNDKLEHPIVTPTTKDAVHDRPITPEDIVKEGLMSESQWEYAKNAALELFAYGRNEAKKRNLILVDTKYEMGIGNDGTIMLIDEVHTPDSSRFWQADSYEQRHAEGLEPESFDKEFIRLWFNRVCDPYQDEVLPKAPDHLVVELALRYIEAYERITGKEFQFPDKQMLSISNHDRLRANLAKVGL